MYISAPYRNFNFNFYNWLLPALGTLIFLYVRCVWQPSINEHDDDDDDDDVKSCLIWFRFAVVKKIF